MSINLFSLEILTGLIIGLLLGFFIYYIFKKKEDLGSYSSNLQTLTETLKEYQDEIAEERAAIKEKLEAT